MAGQKVAGLAVAGEVAAVGADLIARMLVETDLPVAAIASRPGFADVQHVARHFRAAKQTSPLAYRKALGRRQA